jgi:hypothetical protein
MHRHSGAALYASSFWRSPLRIVILAQPSTHRHSGAALYASSFWRSQNLRIGLCLCRCLFSSALPHRHPVRRRRTLPPQWRAPRISPLSSPLPVPAVIPQLSCLSFRSVAKESASAFAVARKRRRRAIYQPGAQPQGAVPHKHPRASQAAENFIFICSV